jgi:predicted patatin/cPLA2 family phospholipase
MHPVIEHLNNRRDKKIPAFDHQNISLLVCGGLMTSGHGAGTLLALEELGLSHAFDHIYTLSTGFQHTIYFMTNTMSDRLNHYYTELHDKDFFNTARFWDTVDTDYITHIHRGIKLHDHKKISHSNTKLYTRLLDADTHATHFVQVTKESPQMIESIIRATSPVGFLNPGTVPINGTHYRDGGSEERHLKEAIEEILQTRGSHVLIVYNNHNQYDYIQSQNIIEDSNRVFHIVPQKDISANLLCLDLASLKQKIESTKHSVLDNFRIS